jgi:hypothetical protein
LPGRVHVVQSRGDLDPVSGRGDVLAVARAVPLWRTAYPNIPLTIECEPQFARLFAGSFPTVAVSIDKAAELPGADADSINRLSLSGLLGDCSAWPGPYLKPDPELVARYRAIVPPGAVGLCWAASGGAVDSRSVPLRDLAPVWDRHPCVSLQVGGERHQSEATKVLDLLPAAPDWAETAALVACCRAVVTVDTAVAHLAAAMGAQTHILLGAFCVYWPARDQARWYPETASINMRHTAAQPSRWLSGSGWRRGGGVGGWPAVAYRLGVLGAPCGVAR